MNFSFFLLIDDSSFDFGHGYRMSPIMILCASVVSATARKFAVIIWNMLVKNVPYKNPEGYLYLDQKRKLGLVKRIKKQIDKFDIKPEDVGFLNT